MRTAQWRDTGFPGAAGSAVPLDEPEASLPADGPHHWRLRMRSRSPWPWTSHWMGMSGNSLTETDLRVPKRVDLLRNAQIVLRNLDQYPAILTPGRDPVLDPVRDLYLPDARYAAPLRVPGDGAFVGEGNPGVVIFYEVFHSGPLRVAKEGVDVVLSGW
jgi:hypothetical protein